MIFNASFVNASDFTSLRTHGRKVITFLHVLVTNQLMVHGLLSKVLIPCLTVRQSLILMDKWQLRMIE